ncbi:filamentous hemagglutinin outer membrane protein [Calothrix sp. NIES-4071]|nr:filamentous hemagglutinin outer membrane protein [Calothrix sp. NIES-4071]BAZ62376.1 filamentous hemagglutinin outer membrane protein [Calothrix sp. NIES-4105]
MKSCAPLTVILALVFSSSANAQIIPDATVGSQVLKNININGVLSDKIDGGAVRGNNLFHR